MYTMVHPFTACLYGNECYPVHHLFTPDIASPLLLQFSPQIDKHLLLRELTEDINQIRSKGIVLNELAACVAAG